MTGLQAAVLGGALTGLGLALLGSWWVPARPDLGDALARLSHPSDVARAAPVPVLARRDRVGLWVARMLPARWATWGPAPTADLAVLRMPLSRFCGEKARLAVIGAVAPPVWAVFAAAVGVAPPLLVPVGASLVVAVAAWFAPDLRVREAARTERAAFVVAVGAWADLVALERLGGSATRQAMEKAAAIGEGPAFARLREVLRFSSHDRTPAWDALAALGQDLAVPQVVELAETMRLGGQEGAQIVTMLRARSASIRESTLTAQIRRAGQVGERLVVPTFVLAALFVVFVTVPALLRLLAAG